MTDTKHETSIRTGTDPSGVKMYAFICTCSTHSRKGRGDWKYDQAEALAQAETHLKDVK